jgi:transcription elongation factor/antiterminator RfaH
MDGLFGLPSAERRWYAVKAQPRKEDLAVLHLRRQGFLTFLPYVCDTARRLPRPAVVRKPFFPGYLFVKLSLEVDRWRSVNGTIGVSRLVQFGDRPTSAPRGLVEHLIQLTSEDGELQFDDPLVNGASVRVIGGPFDSFMGILERADANERVTILIEVMARKVSVSVPRSSVMVLSSEPGKPV